MAALFTAADLARAETLSRTLLTPLTAPSVDDWRRDVNRALRDLFGGDAALFMLPGTDTLYLSDEAPLLVRGLQEHAEISADGLHVVHDPVSNLWQEIRRTDGMDAFSWVTNEAMLKHRGEDMSRSPLVQELLLGGNLRDFVGAYVTSRAGEVLVWVLHEKPGGIRFGADDAGVMKAFVPALRSGLNALDHLAAHRSALDLVAEPIAVFDLGGRELYRNTALASLMGTDPESNRVLDALRLVADEVRRSCLPRRFAHTSSLVVPPMRQVRTRRALYDVRATVVAPGAFDRDEAILASVQAHTAPSLPGPSDLRSRFDLTPREAEVAGLLAGGLTNADIADRLFISPHTTKRHVEKVLDKLGVSSRAAVHAKLLQPVS